MIGSLAMEGVMTQRTADRRFFATTRGQVLTLLRRGNQSVDDLALALGVSDNAIRSHLQSLERDGLVAHEGVRRGVGKPAWLYRLSPEADRIFPKPYATALEMLLRILSERLPPEDIDAILAEVGQRMAGSTPRLTGSTEERLPAVIDAIGEIGGLAELDEGDDCAFIRGYDCPLTQAVQHYPDACRVVQSLLETMLEQPVVQQCDHGDRPRCRFAVPLNEAAS
jgi:predicted ArsR family transcriptional regulator